MLSDDYNRNVSPVTNIYTEKEFKEKENLLPLDKIYDLLDETMKHLNEKFLKLLIFYF